MFKKNKTVDFEEVDRARERMALHANMEKLKNVGLFLLVTIVLTWLVMGVM